MHWRRGRGRRQTRHNPPIRQQVAARRTVILHNVRATEGSIRVKFGIFYEHSVNRPWDPAREYRAYQAPSNTA